MNAAQPAISGAAILENPAPDQHTLYFQRVVPEPFRILRRTLLPLSLGRYRLMKRFNVALVADGDAQAGVSDLLLGVLICSLPVAEFIAFANSPDFSKEVRRWSRSICPSPWVGAIPFLGKWWRKNHSFNVIEKIGLFQRYIQDGSQAPRYWDESQDARVSGAHWSHSIEVVLRAEVGWTAEEINEEPLNKALADYFKYMETQGQIRLMTDDEIEYLDTPATPEQIKAMEEWAAKLKAAGVGVGEI